MIWNIRNILLLILCLLSYFLAVWACIVNIQEIVERGKGHYTVFAQRTNLGDGGAIVYCGLWTLAFLLLFILSLNYVIRRRIAKAGIYATILILLFIISNYVDSLMYIQLG